jgi:hypothetical protein
MRMERTDTVRCADDEALISLLCASGATDGTKCATPGTAATGVCMRPTRRAKLCGHRAYMNYAYMHYMVHKDEDGIAGPRGRDATC